MEHTAPGVRRAVMAVLRSPRFAERLESILIGVRARPWTRVVLYAMSTAFLMLTWPIVEQHSNLEQVKFAGLFLPAYCLLTVVVLVVPVIPGILATHYEFRIARSTMQTLGALGKSVRCMGEPTVFPDAIAAIEQLAKAISEAKHEVVVISPNLIYFQANLWAKLLGPSVDPSFRGVMSRLGNEGTPKLRSAIEGCQADVVLLVPDPLSLDTKAHYRKRADLIGMDAADLDGAHKAACSWARDLARHRRMCGLVTRIEHIMAVPPHRIIQADDQILVQEFPDSRASLTEPVVYFAAPKKEIEAIFSHCVKSLRQSARIARGTTRLASG